MSGYEFEDYIVKLFRKAGFKVEPTNYSNDGGIDLVAYCNIPFFKGKYIVQCKHWVGNVGVREVRELYGVAVAETACKGILITTGDFTEQAIVFSKNKNIELIDGKELQNIIEKYVENATDDCAAKNSALSYFDYERFDLERYKYFEQLIERNPNQNQAHMNRFGVLWQYVIDNDFELLQVGLLTEMQDSLDSWAKLVYKKKPNEYGKQDISLYKMHLHILEGRIDKMLESIIDFGIKRFGDNIQYCFIKKKDCLYFSTIELINYLSICKLVDCTEGMEYIYQKLEASSRTIFEDSYNFRGYLEKYIGEIYIPVAKDLDQDDCLDQQYMPIFNICDKKRLIETCWKSDLEKIRKQIEFIVHMNT